MTLEQEMKLWEKRRNDKFGKILEKLNEATKDFFVPEKDDCGILYTPISKLIPMYEIDGVRGEIVEEAKYILQNYDLLQYKNIHTLYNKLIKIDS